MSKTPEHVKTWIQSLPIKSEISNSGNAIPQKNSRRYLPREYSLQSDDGSQCSSIESVLELRKPDPEAILIGLGFGPPKSSDIRNKIPERFLQPSKLIKNIDFNKFLEQYGGSKEKNQNPFNANIQHDLKLGRTRSKSYSQVL